MGGGGGGGVQEGGVTGNENYIGSMEWRSKTVPRCWDGVLPVAGLQKQKVRMLHTETSEVVQFLVMTRSRLCTRTIGMTKMAWRKTSVRDEGEE